MAAWAEPDLQAMVDLGAFDAQAATPTALRDRYLLAAKQHHPDRGGDPEKMKAINNAYEHLRENGTGHGALRVCSATTIDFTVAP